MIRVAIVEDEGITRRTIALALRNEGFEVFEAADVFAARSLFRSQPVDVMLLDLGLPGHDGMQFAAEFRQQYDAGLIVVTRRSAPEARIEALDLGADDYVLKPVHFGELAARVRSVLRRRQPLRLQRKSVGGWTVDFSARTATRDGEKASLTKGEFDMLSRLMEAGTKIVSREDLLSVVSRRPQESDLRSVDALISRIRRKLEDTDGDARLIVTAPGFGYRLSVAPQDL
ncbi:MAG TPA: response regulator transcription factor [Rhizomicrobium sp.]|jgi:DNA-binding response OmpR family regulator|nr:response regulator transcription factor [Rhizomicrobium sp.]